MEGENNIDIKKKIEASDANQPKIVMIPIDKIRASRWSTGIRDLDVYERLKENIKQHGLNNPNKIFPLDDGLYEEYIGGHRVSICRELGWKEVPCIIDDIDLNEALERCLSDNICRADYNSVELEDKVTELYNSGRYPAKVTLGKAIGLTGQRVGQLITAKEIRDKPTVPFDESISTQTIIDTSPLVDINNKVALLELVRARKIKPSDVKDYAKTLAKTSEDTRRKVLYEGQPLSSIGNEKLTLPKKTVSTAQQVHNPNLLPEVYQLLNTLQDHIALIKDDAEKKTAINYVKFYAGLLLKILTIEGVMHRDVFEDLMRRELQIDEGFLHHFDGIQTKGVDWWMKSDHYDDATEYGGATSNNKNQSTNEIQVKP